MMITQIYFYLTAMEMFLVFLYYIVSYTKIGWWAHPVIGGAFILICSLLLAVLFFYLGSWTQVHSKKTSKILKKLTKGYFFLLSSFFLVLILVLILMIVLKSGIFSNALFYPLQKHYVLLYVIELIVSQTLLLLIGSKFKCSISSFPSFIQNHEKCIVALIQITLILSFFAPTFLQSKLPINSDYLLQFEPWKSVYLKDDNSLVNNVLSDSIDSRIPNRSFFNSSINRGEFPLWNPYISSGTPFGFLLFSGTFALDNLTSILAGVMWGSILYFFLKLFILGYFTYLFLRQCGLGKISSIFGMVAVTFSSYIITNLGNRVADSIVYLPVILYFGKQYIKTSSFYYFFATSLIVMIDVLSGFPAITFYSLLLASFYFVFYVFFDQGLNKSFSQRIKQLVLIALSFIAGFSLAGFSLLPTYEFFNNINLSYRSGRGGSILPLESMWRLLNGNICGNPVDKNWFCKSNYNETSLYVGIIPLLLVPFTLKKSKLRKTSLFFIVTTVMTIMVVFGIGGLNTVLAKLPVFNINSSTRMIALLPFSLGIASAIGFENLLHLRTKSKYTLFIGAGFICLAMIISYIRVFNPYYAEKSEFITHQLQLTDFLIILSGIISILLINSQTIHRRQVLAILLIIIAFGDLAYLLYDYNGASNPDTFFPETKGISFLEENQESFERMLSISRSVMVPSFPLYFSINTLFGHWWTSSTYRI